MVPDGLPGICWLAFQSGDERTFWKSEFADSGAQRLFLIVQPAMF
jgi:hypothetical protein